MHGLTSFFRIWTWFSFRQLRRHIGRSLVVLLGISLGAAVFTSVRLAVNASLSSFSRSVDAVSGKADWSVVAPGGRVPENLLGMLARNPSVVAASPISTIFVQSPSKGDLLLLVGLDPIQDRMFRLWRTTAAETGGLRSAWLELIGEPYTLIAGPRVLERMGLGVGERLFLNHIRKGALFRVVGVLEAEGLALAQGGEIAVTDLATFQEFTDTHGFVDRIDLITRGGDQSLSELRSQLPAGVVLQRPSDFKETGRHLMRSYQLNLSVLSFVSLFVGMFLIYSLVSLHVSSRRHELATLRSLGASSRQLFLLFILEGGFFGLLGWAVAIPMGSILVKRLVHLIGTTISNLFVRVQVDQLFLDPMEILGSFLVTLTVSALAAWQPAHEATQVPPQEALMGTSENPGPGQTGVRLAFTGLLLIVGCYPLIKLPVAWNIPLPGYIATFLLFLGTSLLSPWLLQVLGSRLSSVLRRIGGEPAHLGARQIREAGARVAVSVGALITAIGLYVALVIMVYSFRQTVEHWVNQSIGGDLYLRPHMAAVNEYRQTLPDEAVEILERIDRPAVVLPYRRIYLRYGNVPYHLEMLDFEKFPNHGRFLFMGGTPQDVMAVLARGEGVVVSEVFHNQTGLDIGQHFRIQVGAATIDRPIIGIFRDYRTQGGVVYFSFSHFAALTGDARWSGARIDFTKAVENRRDAAKDLKRRLEHSFADNGMGVELTFGEDLRGAILQIFDETFAVTTVLLLIALAVASLGIASTLTVLVLDRTRQFHTILAVGGTRVQIRSMICWEALIMVFTGTLLGFMCGFLLSYLLIFVINRQSFGWTFEYAVDWGSLLASVPLIFGSAVVAALPAGQLVFRRSPAQVLREP